VELSETDDAATAAVTTRHTIGVVVTTYKQGAFLGEALDSVCRQLTPPDAIVVVEDGSSDGAADVVTEYPGVCYHWQENAGVGAARNTGLGMLDTDFVMFLDADDRLKPHALQVAHQAVAAFPQTAWVASRSRCIDSQGGLLGLQPTWRPQVTDDHYRELLRASWICPPSTVAFDRRKLVEIGAWTEDRSISGADDLELYLRMGRTYSLVDLDEITVDYRIHEENVSRNAQKLLEAIVVVLDREKRYISDPVDEDARRQGIAAFRRDLGLRASYQRYSDSVGLPQRAVALLGLAGRIARNPGVFVRMAGIHLRQPRQRSKDAASDPALG
jgi:glycosyltransferase involved in cell wall biosynthesis